MHTTSTQTFTVAGMTCEHCVAAVTSEVSRLAGVSGVDVDLASGRLLVHGDGVDGEAVGAAVQAAGYSLAGSA
ncbi:MAG TPA: cation transporter [Solirubrobacteraceae bacterium]|nr:cation transporter [Solirubrobacteraceae bacterium]